VDVVSEHAEVMAAIRDAVLGAPGELDLNTRLAILNGGGPQAMEAWLWKVRRCAYEVADRDFQALLEAGWSPDALFEALVTAAVGEGLRRYETGVAALR
jgi:hypothetical protein